MIRGISAAAQLDLLPRATTVRLRCRRDTARLRRTPYAGPPWPPSTTEEISRAGYLREACLLGRVASRGRTPAALEGRWKWDVDHLLASHTLGHAERRCDQGRRLNTTPRAHREVCTRSSNVVPWNMREKLATVQRGTHITANESRWKEKGWKGFGSRNSSDYNSTISPPICPNVNTWSAWNASAWTEGNLICGRGSGEKGPLLTPIVMAVLEILGLKGRRGRKVLLSHETIGTLETRLAGNCGPGMTKGRRELPTTLLMDRALALAPALALANTLRRLLLRIAHTRRTLFLMGTDTLIPPPRRHMLSPRHRLDQLPSRSILLIGTDLLPCLSITNRNNHPIADDLMRTAHRRPRWLTTADLALRCLRASVKLALWMTVIRRRLWLVSKVRVSWLSVRSTAKGVSPRYPRQCRGPSRSR